MAISTESLDGKTVRLIVDIVDGDNQLVVEVGAIFTWDDTTDHQYVEGELIFVDPDEIEVLDPDYWQPNRIAELSTTRNLLPYDESF